MLFIPLVLLGIALYFTEWRVWSGVIFLFFISYGFQFVPEALFDTGVVISKSPDFALIYVLVIFLIACFRYDGFVVKSKITIAIFIFLVFVVISMLYSRYRLNVTVEDILRTSRYYFFVLGYFVFRRFSRDEMRQLLQIGFFITTVGCTLYVIQSFTGFSILTGGWKGTFGKLNRYYNIPILYYLFVAYAFFCNPYKGFWRYFSIIIFCLVVIVSQHRGLMIAIFIAAVWGLYISEGGFKGVFKYLLIGGLLFLPVLDIVLDRFGSGTSTDIESVVDGELGDNVGEITSSGTFVFRMGVLYERWLYVVEKPERIVMGVGFMTEGSDRANQEFDFFIGLTDEAKGGIIQLDTADMAWIVFMLRLGFAGTIFYLSLYFIVGKFFYRHRNDKLALAFLLYIVVILISSFTSVEIANVAMMVPALMVYGVMETEQKKNKEVEEIEN